MTLQIVKHLFHCNFLPFTATASKNGYVYIYLSNESTNIPVYFDDFHIKHARGPIVEDNAYYPHGLKIQGMSARAALKPKTKEGYQGDYSERDEETGYNEFALRSYDPQIGRWIQVDPYDIEPGMYNGMGNDPVNLVDPFGGIPDWGWRDNGDGTITHQWFEGLGEGQLPEGWTWEGKNVDAFSIGNGMYASLSDHGKVNYLYTKANGSIADFSTENLIQINANIKCHPDKTYIEVDRARIALEYAKLDFAKGQVDFPQSMLSSFLFGQRTYTGINPVDGSMVENRPITSDGYLTPPGTMQAKGGSPFSLISPAKSFTALPGIIGTRGYRYMSKAELSAIKETGYLRGGLSGETYFTKDLYKSASSARSRLSLGNSPALRVEFEITNSPAFMLKGSKVKPGNGMIGGGSEFMTTEAVKIRLINWQPLK